MTRRSTGRSVAALDNSFDILELLAERSGGLSQAALSPDVTATEPWLSGLFAQTGARIEPIRIQGFERAHDSLQPRIADILLPIFGRAQRAVAALFVPDVATSSSAARTQAVEDRARAAAEKISGTLGQ